MTDDDAIHPAVLDEAERVHAEVHVAIKAAEDRGATAGVVLAVLACCLAEFIRAQPEEETRVGLFLSTVQQMKDDIDVTPAAMVKAISEVCPGLLGRMTPAGEA